MQKRLIIIDTSSFIFRAFYAVRALTTPEGVPVNAVYGILSMLLKLITQYRPSHVLMARDLGGGSFRNELYSAYKANRDAPPEELIPQFAIVQDLIEKMELPHCGIENYEADDVIGAACVQWRDYFDEIYIASGDKDLMQFVDDKIKMLDTMKDKLYGPGEVFEKMGVRPNQIMDYLAMLGDTSDNIPGMKGIGAKGAAKLLEEYQTLENCIAHKDEFKGKKLIEAFSVYLENGLLSRKLVEIKTDINLGLKPEETVFDFLPSSTLIQFLKGLGFKSLLKKIEDIAIAKSKEVNGEHGEFKILSDHTSSSNHKIILVKDKANLKLLENEINSARKAAFFVIYDCDDVISKKIEGISICFKAQEAYVISFVHDWSTILETDFYPILKKIFNIHELILENSKQEWSYCLNHQILLNSKIFDTSQAHYNVNASLRHDLERLAQNYLGENLTALDKKEIFSEQGEEFTKSYLGERSISLFSLKDKLDSELKKFDLESIYYDIDNPLIKVLAEVENAGVYLNSEFLKELEGTFTIELDSIEKRINKIIDHYAKDHKIDIEEINIKSPKQVGHLLFDILKLPVIKKTKTGPSTDSEVLSELDSRGLSDIPGEILKYRELDKLLSTYVKALPLLVNIKTNRVHTSFNQFVTATGRLSSNNPNLQNIPVRSENGKLIRKAFVATPGKLLLSADYSQVELRLLAHFSEDPTMVNAFLNDEDIHAQTAAEIMGVSISEVTSDMRSQAKAVNFGLMYGQSSFGLSRQLKIGRKEAKEYITKYFEKFSNIKSYLDGLKDMAEEKGYSETLFGRKRFLPDLKSNNRTIKSMAERLAVNSPIQGTAADIIKKAMIEIDEEMKRENLRSKMILQVHDELIFEVLEEELEAMKAIVRSGMETVTALKVPLKVDMGIGVNWFDLK